MFSLTDFYYLLIMCSINTNVSEKEYDTIQSDRMIDRLYRACKRLSLRSAGTQLVFPMLSIKYLGNWVIGLLKYQGYWVEYQVLVIVGKKSFFQPFSTIFETICRFGIPIKKLMTTLIAKV